jgi:hypothetical protein
MRAQQMDQITHILAVVIQHDPLLAAGLAKHFLLDGLRDAKRRVLGEKPASAGTKGASVPRHFFSLLEG